MAIAVIFLISGNWNTWAGERVEQATDDAYVRADLTPLSTKAAGLVASVEVSDYQAVKAGDLLVRLRDEDFIESADNRCRLNFVVQNKSRVAIESMKLDLVGFDTDGGIVRRLITDMGPVRAAKTVVRAFIVDIDCHQLGAVLVNDVTACAPGEPGTCLDVLGLSSRVKTVRLYK
jgi:hypothetical protein